MKPRANVQSLRGARQSAPGISGFLQFWTLPLSTWTTSALDPASSSAPTLCSLTGTSVLQQGGKQQTVSSCVCRMPASSSNFPRTWLRRDESCCLGLLRTAWVRNNQFFVLIFQYGWHWLHNKGFEMDGGHMTEVIDLTVRNRCGTKWRKMNASAAGIQALPSKTLVSGAWPRQGPHNPRL